MAVTFDDLVPGQEALDSTVENAIRRAVEALLRSIGANAFRDSRGNLHFRNKPSARVRSRRLRYVAHNGAWGNYSMIAVDEDSISDAKKAVTFSTDARTVLDGSETGEGVIALNVREVTGEDLVGTEEPVEFMGHFLFTSDAGYDVYWFDGEQFVVCDPSDIDGGTF